MTFMPKAEDSRPGKGVVVDGELSAGRDVVEDWEPP